VVYDENVQVHNIKSPLKAKSIYAASKIAGENLCYSYREYRNIQPIIVRLGATIGAGLTHGLIYDIIRKLKTNNELELLGNEPGSCKPFTYINDVLGGIHTAINTNISLCNLCNQNPITVKTVAETVMDTLNIHKKIVWNDANWAGDNNTLFGESFLNGCSIEAVKRCVNDIVGNN
jgi:UDP-glucose 4-epimerase